MHAALRTVYTGISIKGMASIREKHFPFYSVLFGLIAQPKDLKMKWVLFLSASMVLATASELYTTENDDFEIEKADGPTIKNILGCFLDSASCDERGADFKKHIPEAMEQACAKCTAAQKHIFKVFLEIIQKQEKEGYQAFQQKYDPENKYLGPLQVALAQ